MSGVCEYCQSGFSCGRLYAALRIAEAHPELLKDVNFARQFAALQARLAAAGWSYPDGGKPCALVGRDAEIGRLTEQVIAGFNQWAEVPKESIS